MIVAAAILGAAARADAACSGQAGPSGAVTFEAAGTTRSFVVRVPSSGDGRSPRPVVIALHPFGMNGQYMQSRVPSRVWPDAIMVYPDALAGRGAPGWQGRAGDASDRDLVFFDALLAWLQAEQCVDAARIFVLGYSNGAGLASLLACERPDAIAGVAMAAGRPACEPSRAMPVIISHGTRDATAPYEDAIRAARAWSSVNGCKAPPRAGAPGCVAAEQCGAAAVTLCTHAGGHEYSSTFSRAAAEFFQSVGR